MAVTRHSCCTCFGSTYTKIGTIQRRLAWPLRKDDTQIREAFHIFSPPLDMLTHYGITLSTIQISCLDLCYHLKAE